ncbi:hypothetical protein LAUMK35_02410 [Mycobacterium pseudokansasii]|uniref:Uncharacterized protein n=1 Tax=Mycobacterium pseudokansasii TaxID=2341080 RepID=A0A498QT51_9MYCO|nr:hypothetical protein LAUMK35_02410 [Mycobacterium pseudokansasii]VAZ94734.1 hypothetical protein LAUMK21_02411 [Mycobacterium pseudokansasii]VBA49983.1 hypothetical protein LAUMK142_02302 [Mycobacterium pseudokansasii]
MTGDCHVRFCKSRGCDSRLSDRRRYVTGSSGEDLITNLGSFCVTPTLLALALIVWANRCSVAQSDYARAWQRIGHGDAIVTSTDR